MGPRAGCSGYQSKKPRSMVADRSELTERRRSYIGAVMRSAGLKSMASLAKKLAVTQSTLTNIQSGKRSASPELIEKISKLAPAVEDGSILGADAVGHPDEPKANTREIGKRLHEDQRQQIQELQGLEEQPPQNIKDIARNFEAMDKDDVFVYLSAIRSPLEMDPDEPSLKPAIAGAILRRAFFIYLRPTKAHLKSLGNYVDVHAEFDEFKRTVFENIAPDQRRSFWRHLLLIQADGNPLFALPDFKWELFFSDRIDAPYKVAANALVAAGRPPSHPGLNIRIPLSTTASKRVLFEVAKTICLANPTLKELDQMPFDVVARLKESAELAAQVKMGTHPS